MSLKAITVACDWPGCTKVLDTPFYPSVLHDRNWAARDSEEHGPHLCPGHRFRTWEELADFQAARATP